MGSINGSAVANVVGTGTFTIPLMKSRGYKPAFGWRCGGGGLHWRPDTSSSYGLRVPS